MNYSELVAEIQSYTENVFSTADIDTFITQAEERIVNAVQLPVSWHVETLVTSSGFPTVTLPVDYLYTLTLALVTPSNRYEYLINKDASFLKQAFPTNNDGQPIYYALTGPYQITLAPIPDDAYNLVFTYSRYPPSIVTAGTSWLGENFSSTLLYGALVEAYTFMKGDQDMMALYDTKFKEAMALLKQLVDAKNRQDTYRSGQVRYPVK